ncbi:type I-E CRISPR-associated protein Cas5/CasD [Paucidesulfovibrio longus]|uniref:type I-E CRISPR-associated protein Cas5/CasD n=1 Tax=Paucidesulfovibrio longus TaxID=889 RepID=UPI0003B62B69|nr:type I-E CRISPR-associated protein Cas5/CasD [Paucidesulfovibrio longus]
MREYLLFTLSGPLQAWGTVAVGEIRPISGRPTRSGVFGLLAACLGIRRDEENRLAALHEGYHFAVRVDAPGERFIDYHTVQTPRERAKLVYRTRQDELGRMLGPDDEPNTILTRREYLAGSVFTACVWAREEPPHPLAELRDALFRPRLTPYLGRKSCPADELFRPEIVEAADFAEALARREAPYRTGIVDAADRDVFSDELDGLEKLETFIVRDQVSHHGRRQFSVRPEHRLRAGE